MRWVITGTMQAWGFLSFPFMEVIMLEFDFTNSIVDFAQASDHSILVNKIIATQHNDGSAPSIVTYEVTSGLMGSLSYDRAGLSDSLELEFEIPEEWANVEKVDLYHDDQLVCSLTLNELLSVGSGERVRLSGTCENARKLRFETVRASVPYATTFGSGTVRFTADDEVASADTVYSSAKIDEKLRDISAGQAEGYVPWDTNENGAIVGSVTLDTLNATDGVITFDGRLQGDSVALEPSYGDGVLNTSNQLVTDTYIASMISSEVSADMPNNLVTSSGIAAYVDAADNNLQSQIDALNAGQNLADIVNDIAALEAYDTTHLEARGAEEADGSVVAIGDKIQVLHDTKNAGTSVQVTETPYNTVGTDGSGNPISSLSEDGFVYFDFSADRMAYVWLERTDELTNVNDIEDWNNVIIRKMTHVGRPTVDNDNPASMSVSGGSFNEDYTVTLTKIEGGSTVYQLVSGTISETDYTSIPGSAEGVYWEYIGEYGCDSYSHAEADAKFATKEEVELAGSNFVKLTSNEQQEIVSPISINGINIEPDGYRFSTESDGATASLELDPYRLAFEATHSDPDMGDAAVSGISIDPSTSTFAVTLQNEEALRIEGANGDMPGVSGTLVAKGDGMYDDDGYPLPDRLVTESYLNEANNTLLNNMSAGDSVGSIGLFLYTGPADELGLGATVNGSSLTPVAMSLPLSGEIAYKAVGDNRTGAWTLLSAAYKADESAPCLVMAMKTGTDYAV